MTAQLTTIYRITSDGKTYEWQNVEEISINRIIVEKHKVHIDFRHLNGKGDSKVNMKEVEGTNHSEKGA